VRARVRTGRTGRTGVRARVRTGGTGVRNGGDIHVIGVTHVLVHLHAHAHVGGIKVLRGNTMAISAEKIVLLLHVFTALVLRGKTMAVSAEIVLLLRSLTMSIRAEEIAILIMVMITATAMMIAIHHAMMVAVHHAMTTIAMVLRGHCQHAKCKSKEARSTLHGRTDTYTLIESRREERESRRWTNS